MVLVYIDRSNDEANEDSNGDSIFINAVQVDDGKLVLTVLQPDRAYTCDVTSTSDCVVRWARNLQVTPAQYLHNFLEAITSYSSAAHTHSKKIVEKSTKSSEDATAPEHEFEINRGCLSWRKYFADKKVHGKRGNFPLDEVSHSSACWSVLQGAAEQQHNTLEKLQQAKLKCEKMSSEYHHAEELAQQSVEIKQKFQEQTYAKFCKLLNSKKQQIRTLTSAVEQLKGAQQTSEAMNTCCASSSGASSSVPLGPASLAPKEAAHDRSHSDSDDFNDDTDVDDIDQSNTDDEKEIRIKKKIVEPLKEFPLDDERVKSNIKTARNDIPKGKSSVNTGKRKEDPSVNENVGRHAKKTASLDSQDSFDSSFDESGRQSLLTNIKPRVDEKQVSKHSVEKLKHRVLHKNIAINTAGSSMREVGFNVTSSSDNDTASFVANILRKNVQERKSKGLSMPRRCNEFDMLYDGDGGGVAVETHVSTAHETASGDNRIISKDSHGIHFAVSNLVVANSIDMVLSPDYLSSEAFNSEQPLLLSDSSEEEVRCGRPLSPVMNTSSGDRSHRRVSSQSISECVIPDLNLSLSKDSFECDTILEETVASHSEGVYHSAYDGMTEEFDASACCESRASTSNAFSKKTKMFDVNRGAGPASAVSNNGPSDRTVAAAKTVGVHHVVDHASSVLEMFGQDHGDALASNCQKLGESELDLTSYSFQSGAVIEEFFMK